ncbi:MAG: MarR family winged helix-turn-helix transcriptional regulator [Melioribacteraceae bacterium]|nr:MarR family winged helix-turn-helix transcriptional regulator [Melioribacteraceae bacterium]
MNRLAEEEFMITGLSPAHAIALVVVYENPGITPKRIALELKLASSTITRFLDALEKKQLIKRSVEGKNSKISITEKGNSMYETIKNAWQNLNDRYLSILGEKSAKVLTQLINFADNELKL